MTPDRRDTDPFATSFHPLRQSSNCGVGVLMDLQGEPTHELIEDGLTMLENLDHRGARGAEEKTGDGAGVLLQKPHAFFQQEFEDLGEPDGYGVGQLFMPPEDRARRSLIDLVEERADREGFEVVGWRDVPTNNDDLGRTARETEPQVVQVVVWPEESLEPDELDGALYVLRRVIENAVDDRNPPGADSFYICSLDRRKLVYKGLLTNAQVRSYYPDLSRPSMKTALAFVHSRFSTNTLGSWELAHPYRNIIHNGEINTLRGNLNWMHTREADLFSERFGEDIEKIKPITHEDQSDTAVLDNVLELLVQSGRSLPHALRMLVPEVWNRDQSMDPDRRRWYEYHSTIVEPWDGPALVAFTDGESVGAILDRNGLRPCRYYVTHDDRLIMASEAGVLDTPAAEVKEKGRLQPGEMFMADAEEGRIVPDKEVFDDLTDPKYDRRLREQRVKLSEVKESLDSAPEPDPSRSSDGDSIHRVQAAMGYTREYLTRLLRPMSEEGRDPIGAMGDDTPLAVLSSRNKTMFDYFKQLFAQVSNPPIDYIREELVTSLESHIGRQNNLIGDSEDHCRQLFIPSPILRREEYAAIESIDHNGIRSSTLDLTFTRGTSLEEAVRQLRHDAVRAIVEGDEILILSDRRVGPDRLAIPALLAVGGVHHHLIREGLRTRVGLVLESGQPCAVHHVATLIGYGAEAVYPYLAYESLRTMHRDGNLDDPGPVEEVLDGYVHGLEHGLLKVMAKMGISTLESYKGAQIFEAVGLNSDLVEDCFRGTTTRTEGIGLDEIEEDLRERHDRAFQTRPDGNLTLEQGGDFYWRRDGEFHQWNPKTIGKLQQAVRRNDYETYREFAGQINEQDNRLQTLRGMLDFDTSRRESVPLEDVEPVESIRKRFFTGSMSFGSLSKETHETLAVAMNRIGATACSGEGGEPPDRYGTERECINKQVASGRFGVTGEYLVSAEELEIKMAQGSKPGEGGHLPGGKVNEVIAEVRHSTPGVALISPPPHHDIYSIEDLAQLIHDLKCSNPGGDVSVKLVSEDGVGIIAAGVAKARADIVLISGQSGGTGASPKTSIKSAGLPWELGLAEAQRVLGVNRLRDRIEVRVDGGLKTGRDAVVACLLGAEKYGYGTAPLVALGCVMLRKCHTNTCSVGVATQDPELRDRFAGRPEHVINYMTFLAREIREIMAELGFRSMDNMVGQAQILEPREVSHRKARRLDLSRLIDPVRDDRQVRKTTTQNHFLENKLDNRLIEYANPALENRQPVQRDVRVTNRNRTVGAMLSSLIVERFGSDGLPDDTVRFDFTGSAGQSFGAFLASGITFGLEGDANDYIGKGLSGGKLIVSTPEDAGYRASDNILIGNVALYGATQGEAYFNGRAGERFAVRNSGVLTVVEGIGDHGCEYMTGGVAVVLGPTGKNFAAGMSGGEAYVLDVDGQFEERINRNLVRVQPLDEERDEELVKRLIGNHRNYTNSERAESVLEDWHEYRERFVKVIPEAYSDIIIERAQKGEDIRVSLPPEARPARELAG